MKITHTLLVLAVAAAAAFSGSARAAATVGAAAPEFSVTDIDGKTHRLADYKGKVVVLEWTNPECPFVGKHYGSGNLPALQRGASGDGVVWLAINSGRAGAQGDLDNAEAAAWLKSHQAEPAGYVRDTDGRLGRLYGAKTTPHLFVIGADGTLVYSGAIDSIRSASVEDIGRATNYVKVTLAALKAGRPVEKPATQPYGCGVKY